MFRHIGAVAIFLVSVLGLGNFALHKAVLESRHPMLGELPAFFRRSGGKASLAVEFVILLTALLLVANGYSGWAWAYLGYSLFNGVSAWLILSGRI
jgi:hypothetical protein